MLGVSEAVGLDCDDMLTAERALGTDTGGSVRLPAAYTDLVGFKPSYGMLSRWGVIPYANSLDTVGILSKDVESSMSLFGELRFFPILGKQY